MMAEYNANNGAALARLVNDQGVELREFSDDVYDAFGSASAEVFQEVQDHLILPRVSMHPSCNPGPILGAG